LLYATTGNCSSLQPAKNVNKGNKKGYHSFLAGPIIALKFIIFENKPYPLKKVILFFFILAFNSLFAQKMSYTGIILVDSIPEEMLPPGVSELGFITAGDNNQPVGFGYDAGGGTYKIISKFGREYDNYAAGEVKAYFRNDTVFFSSKIKYKTEVTLNYYNWDSKKLTFLETYISDPSKEAERNGEAALRKKEIREASLWYNQVENVPLQTQAKTAYNLLNVGHYLADDAMQANSFKEAVEYMDGAFVYSINKSLIESKDEFAFYKIVMNTFEHKQSDSLGPWLCDYAFYLLKADSLERSVKLSRFVVMCFPTMPEAQLILADVLYDSGQSEEAVPYYDKYIVLMEKRGDESLIPERAKERHK
jgi:hypothetical protein